MRPFYLGVGDNVGVKPAKSYVFRVFVSPVGPYFKGGFGPDQGKDFMVCIATTGPRRAAPATSRPGATTPARSPLAGEARAEGFAEALYLDPATRTFIEEIGAANFLALKGGVLITPDSRSILPSLTRDSLMQIADKLLGWGTETRPIALAELGEVDSAACCGTAAIITWIRRIVSEERTWEFEFDPRWQQLYDTLVGIQTGAAEDPFGWRHEIPIG